MQKILPTMSALGVCGELKGLVAVVWDNVETVRGTARVGNVSGA